MISPELLTFTLLSGVLVFSLLLRSINQKEFTKYEQIRSCEIGFLGIGLMQHTLTFIYETSYKAYDEFPNIVRKFTYASWLFGAPLLLFTYYKLAEINGYKDDFMFLFFASIIFFICIILYESIFTIGLMSGILKTIALLCYGVLVWQIVKIRNFFQNKKLYKMKRLGLFFFTWILYFIASLLHDEPKVALYTITDFINRFLYGMTLNSIIGIKDT